MNIFFNGYKFFSCLLYVVINLLLLTQYACAESASIKNYQTENNPEEIAQKIEIYNNESIELDLKIKHAELEIKRLREVKSPENEFDAKNEVIGLKYEITVWQEELKNIKATISGLKKINQANSVRDKASVQNSPTENSNNTNQSMNNQSENISQPSIDILNNIRKQQRALIEESYTLEPAAAALNLAKAKALDPLSTAPLFGEKSPLGSYFPASSSTRYNGMMIHMGGNQYMLEAYLRPGKQEFVIGNTRFMRVVPVQYDGVVSLILVDAQDPKKPTLEYFTK